ncbi:MAG TPA: hypothetical protein VLZ74_01005 [Methylocella sp.]|nr:hypothetical protein [Methylocella sp.]
MGNFSGIDPQITESFRLAGIGWIFAFFVVGACLLTASFLINWQVRRIQKMMEQKQETPPDSGETGATKSP